MFKIHCVFYTYSTSQLRLTTFQAFSSHTWLLDSSDLECVVQLCSLICKPLPLPTDYLRTSGTIWGSRLLYNSEVEPLRITAPEQNHQFMLPEGPAMAT